tara:strand:- start:27 stop:464 length:438 start_codon:yes stop_codon:yes gene_type:complete
MKHCNSCDTTKPLEGFHKNKKRKDGHAVHCKPCAINASKKWQRSNSERHLATVQRCHTKHPDVCAAQAGKNTAWKRNGKVYDSIPHDFDIHATVPFYKEARSLSIKLGIKYEVDHIIPIEQGGLHTPNNLRVITATENRSSGGQL